MKNMFLNLVLFSSFTFGQYSDYYRVDVNSNSKVEYSGNVNVNKTITTIDYGALRLANAQMERNRLESIKYNDDRAKAIAIEIANDPSKAVDYGNQINIKLNKKWIKNNGLKKGVLKYKDLNNLLFQKEDWTSVNYGNDKIRTEIRYIVPRNIKKALSELAKSKDEFSKMWFNFFKQLNDTKNLESSIKDNYVNKFGTVGKKNSQNYYVHFVGMSKTRVNGINGFKVKVVMEDDYEKIIDNTFFAYDENANIYYGGDCLIKGDTNEVTFEELEGKNEYFRKLYVKFLGQKGWYF